MENPFQTKSAKGLSTQLKPRKIYKPKVRRRVYECSKSRPNETQSHKTWSVRSLETILANNLFRSFMIFLVFLLLRSCDEPWENTHWGQPDALRARRILRAQRIRSSFSLNWWTAWRGPEKPWWTKPLHSFEQLLAFLKQLTDLPDTFTPRHLETSSPFFCTRKCMGSGVSPTLGLAETLGRPVLARLWVFQTTSQQKHPFDQISWVRQRMQAWGKVLALCIVMICLESASGMLHSSAPLEANIDMEHLSKSLSNSVGKRFKTASSRADAHLRYFICSSCLKKSQS